MHEFEYRAPKPVKTKFQWFKIIALRVIFLPILLWDLLSILVNALIGRYIAVSYFHLQGTSENWDYMQERTGFAPLSESPEDIRDAILETKEMGKTTKPRTNKINHHNKTNSMDKTFPLASST